MYLFVVIYLSCVGLIFIDLLAQGQRISTRTGKSGLGDGATTSPVSSPHSLCRPDVYPYLSNTEEEGVSNLESSWVTLW